MLVRAGVPPQQPTDNDVWSRRDRPLGPSPGYCKFSLQSRPPTYLLPRPVEDPRALAECLSHLGDLRRRITQDGKQLNFLMLLLRFHPFQASDPRDKVYSLLGLAVDGDAMNLQVDYTIAPEKLYIKVASRILALYARLDILYHNLPTKTLSLPSWVPDWSTWVYGTDAVINDWIYSASGSSTPNVRVHASENRIELNGGLIGQICRISSPIGPYYRTFDPADTKTRNRWLQAQEEFVSSLQSYPVGSETVEILWRTLIGNVTLSGMPADVYYQAYFDAHTKAHEGAPAKQMDMAREFVDAVRRKSRSRRLASLENGYLPAVPETSMVGDWVCLIHGIRHLFVIRRQQGNFILIGPTYVHGLMHGEALCAGWYRGQTISLI